MMGVCAAAVVQPHDPRVSLLSSEVRLADGLPALVSPSLPVVPSITALFSATKFLHVACSAFTLYAFIYSEFYLVCVGYSLGWLHSIKMDKLGASSF